MLTLEIVPLFKETNVLDFLIQELRIRERLGEKKLV